LWGDHAGDALEIVGYPMPEGFLTALPLDASDRRPLRLGRIIRNPSYR